MNKVRERILASIEPYMDFAEHKDLIAFVFAMNTLLMMLKPIAKLKPISMNLLWL